MPVSCCAYVPSALLMEETQEFFDSLVTRRGCACACWRLADGTRIQTSTLHYATHILPEVMYLYSHMQESSHENAMYSTTVCKQTNTPTSSLAITLTILNFPTISISSFPSVNTDDSDYIHNVLVSSTNTPGTVKFASLQTVIHCVFVSKFLHKTS